MNNFFLKKIILYYFIFSLLLINIYSDDCLTHSFPDLSYPKSKTLFNGYHIMVTAEGIFSFNPKLTKIEYSYNFTTSQKFSVETDDMKNTINQVEISQFSDEDGGKEYVVIYANNYIYFLNEYGNLKFSQKIEDANKIDTENSITLVAFQYKNGVYSFILAYNFIDYSYNNYHSIKLYHYQINNENSLSLYFTTNNQYSDSLSLGGLSCQAMFQTDSKKVLTCFVNVKSSDVYVNAATNYNLEELSYLSYSNPVYESDNQEVLYFKSSIDKDRKNALICYSLISSEKVKCLSYNSVTNILSDVFITTDYCDTKYFGFNIYYHQSPNEYVFSCINALHLTFSLKRISINFTLINDNDNTFQEKSFEDCYSLYFFSVIYLNNAEQYSAIVHSKCNSEISLRIFMLSNSICIKPDILTTLLETTPTTINIITTIPKIPTTIISTIPLIPTTIPETAVTTISFYEPQKIITTQPEITITTIVNVKSDIITSISTILEDTEQIDIKTENLCDDDNKIYFEGKCICDRNKGYYSINSKSSDNKCYKESDIPKNVYFNNITQTYEACYKTCATCNKEGSNLEHNCLTCVVNYIKEPRNNSTNCVEDCRYLYYYDLLNQYICTEDEQCPNDASLIVRSKDKCVNKCSNDDTNIYQYNGECLSSCPIDTEPNNYNICQISDINACSISDFTLNLDENINHENVKLAAQNYAKEFYYTINHITRFLSQNFSMILYKNGSCIDSLKLNNTKIEYDSCIEQLKIDNNIKEDEEIIIAVIDIISGENPITSFGFFNSETGEKLDATKSCSDKDVIMYESIFNLLNDPLALKLLQEQKINIFDSNDAFYKDICFHFDSPNGKDATLQDRIKTFYPNVTLCDDGCRNKGINITTMKAECECTFQDLLSNNLFQNDLFGNNVLIKETVEEIMEMFSNLNIEVLTCYKDVFNFKYFKKNIGGFIILALILTQIICFIYYIYVSKRKLLRYIYSLTEQYILSRRKESDNEPMKNPPKKVQKNKIEKKIKNITIYKDKRNNSKCENINKDEKYKFKKDSNKYLKFKTAAFDEKTKNLLLTKSNMSKNKNITINAKTKKNKIINSKNTNNYFFVINQSSLLNNNKNDINIFNNTKSGKLYKNKEKLQKSYYLINNNEISLEKFLESSYEDMDYDDVIEEDKRNFCQYYCEKIKKNQSIINSFFIKEITKPMPIKISIFILTIDLYLLINGLFFNESYISEIFNSTEKETIFSFVPRSIGRFVYSTLVGNIITIIVHFSLVEENEIKKILSKKKR